MGNCINKANGSGYCNFNYAEQEEAEPIDIFENLKEISFEAFEAEIVKWSTKMPQQERNRNQREEESETWVCEDCQVTNSVDYGNIKSACCQNRSCSSKNELIEELIMLKSQFRKKKSSKNKAAKDHKKPDRKQVRVNSYGGESDDGERSGNAYSNSSGDEENQRITAKLKAQYHWCDGC